MIYADHNATSPLDSELIEYYCDRLSNGPYANPNSIHSKGQAIFAAIEQCRQICAKALGCSAHQIIFNSGASEGISNIFFHFLAHQKPQKFIVSCIEHSAIIEASNYYQNLGHEVFITEADEDGKVDVDSIEKIIKKEKDISFVSVMGANNETGVIQPIQEIGSLCKNYQIPFFSDTTQLIGKVPFHFNEINMDFAVCSGHKLGALTGVGLIICKEPKNFSPLVFGGGQEGGMRGGTQNYLAIEGLSFCLGQLSKKLEYYQLQNQQKLNFEKALKTEFPNSIVIGQSHQRTPNTTMVAFPGIHGQAIQIELESKDIFVTTSSACSDNDPHTSKVLKCMRLKDDIGRSVIRISPGPKNCEKEYQEIFSALKEIIPKLSKLNAF
jgi:cysteine desulfurase